MNVNLNLMTGNITRIKSGIMINVGVSTKIMHDACENIVVKMADV